MLTRARGSTLSFGVALPRYRRIGTRTRDSVARMAAVRAGHRKQADMCTIADYAVIVDDGQTTGARTRIAE